jgi:hypothetical protein
MTEIYSIDAYTATVHVAHITCTDLDFAERTYIEIVLCGFPTVVMRASGRKMYEKKL